MFRIGLAIICMAVVACSNNKKKSKEDETGFSYQKFSERFKAASLPYQISDTALSNNKDTTTIRSAAFFNFLSDSIKTKLFGKGSKVRYISLVQMKAANETDFNFVKLQSGNKKTVLIYTFEKGSFVSAFPFFVADNDASTSQTSSIDKSLVLTKIISQKLANNVIAEGKEVYEYDAASKQFSLILTDPINKLSADVINPIDSFSRRHKFAGDYGKDKKNFVSIRDGRNANQLLVFMHLDKNEGNCTGELKGDILLTSPTTAIYRQGGDPCVMTLHFTSSAVTIKEDEGCGSHRGLDCSFDGTFTRKKEVKSKPTAKKSTSK